MPRAPWEKLDSKKKDKLLRAAMVEFGNHGYELASINRILEAAEFSKGSFYHSFDDKLDLAVTVFIECAEPETKLVELGLPDTAEAFWAELRRTSMERLLKLESRRLEYQCLIRLANAMITVPEFAEKVRPVFMPGRLKMMAFFERGVALGVLRKDLPLGAQMALIEAAKTAAYKSLFPGDTVPSDAEMESFTDLVLDLARRICAPPKEGRP